MSCGADYWDEQLDDLDDEEPELDGPHLWLRRRWRPIEDLNDIAAYATA